MKEAVAGELSAAYASAIVEQVRANDFTHRSGRLTVHLAREFGFCYGVDRAVDYAYQARRRFPGRNVFLTGEIIHNPHVNDQLREAGIRFLSDAGEHRGTLGTEDVVILPAFGVTVGEMAQLSSQGCTLVDTTCGSVLNVWKNVVRYAQDGFTAVIHGKMKHEETRATASQALKYPAGRYLVVLDRAEAAIVCDYIRHGGTREGFLARFEGAMSPGFDPDRDLERVGCANQTTMLMSESLEIGEMFRVAMRARYGDDGPRDALPGLRHDLQRHAGAAGRGAEPPDRGTPRSDAGRRRLQQQQHVQSCADLRRAGAHVPHRRSRTAWSRAEEIRHRPVGAPSTTAGPEDVTRGWLPRTGDRSVVGLTAGASTPNNIVGQVIETLERFASQADGDQPS